MRPSCSQAGTTMEWSELQPTHKTYVLKGILSTRNVGMEKEQRLRKYLTYSNQPNLRPIPLVKTNPWHYWYSVILIAMSLAWVSSERLYPTSYSDRCILPQPNRKGGRITGCRGDRNSTGRPTELSYLDP